jgi:hypothetical protein
MRRIALASLAALAFAPAPASAQMVGGAPALDINGSGSPMADLQDLNRFATRGYLNQWMATRPARLSNLSPAGRKWLKAEIARQAQAPRSPAEVAVDVDANMARDIKELARTENQRAADVSRALVMKIMLDTKTALALAAWRAHRVDEPGKPSWNERLAQADANKREAMKMQSDASLMLAMD